MPADTTAALRCPECDLTGDPMPAPEARSFLTIHDSLLHAGHPTATTVPAPRAA
jgi:hypothetical protein